VHAIEIELSQGAKPGRPTAVEAAKPRLLRRRELDGVCLAIPGQVVQVLDDANQLAQVDVAGVKRTVNIALLDDDAGAQPGEWVLIHVGFALSKIDEREAHATLALLRAMGEEYEQTLAELRAGEG
jgi:hydrogenase expression/formation protein HypC